MGPRGWCLDPPRNPRSVWKCRGRGYNISILTWVYHFKEETKSRIRWLLGFLADETDRNMKIYKLAWSRGAQKARCVSHAWVPPVVLGYHHDQDHDDHDEDDCDDYEIPRIIIWRRIKATRIIIWRWRGLLAQVKSIMTFEMGANFPRGLLPVYKGKSSGLMFFWS